MKHLILASLFIVFSSFARAQLNQSQSQIMQLMANDNNWKFDGLGHDKAGYPFLSYQSKEKNWTKTFYFNTNDSCKIIKLIIPNDQLSDVVKDMNNKFTSQGGYLWFDKLEKILYGIVLTNNRPFFEVYQTKSTTMWIR